MPRANTDPGPLTADLEYDLPGELVARYPAATRDESRLLVLDRASEGLHHARFRDLPEWLCSGDGVVLNQTRVRPARTFGTRTSGGRVELLWLRGEGKVWEALARPAARLRAGDVLTLVPDLTVIVHRPAEAGIVQLRVPEGHDMEAWLEVHGHMPIPPYLGRGDEPADRERYQTVFARETGAVAAPTAGLHFTPQVFAELERRGVRRFELLLHVGPGTFRPLVTEAVRDHRLDPEWYRILPDVWESLEGVRRSGGRVLAVGTTSVRTLESAARSRPPRLEGWSDLLICEPFDFTQVDHLLTNFHLPRSSLLALVAAFAGRERILEAYRTAVRERYRFYSYGDAMLIL